MRRRLSIPLDPTISKLGNQKKRDNIMRILAFTMVSIFRSGRRKNFVVFGLSLRSRKPILVAVRSCFTFAIITISWLLSGCSKSSSPTDQGNNGQQNPYQVFADSGKLAGVFGGGPIYKYPGVTIKDSQKLPVLPKWLCGTYLYRAMVI